MNRSKFVSSYRIRMDWNDGNAIKYIDTTPCFCIRRNVILCLCTIGIDRFLLGSVGISFWHIFLWSYRLSKAPHKLFYKKSPPYFQASLKLQQCDCLTVVKHAHKVLQCWNLIRFTTWSTRLNIYPNSYANADIVRISGDAFSGVNVLMEPRSAPTFNKESAIRRDMKQSIIS